MINKLGLCLLGAGLLSLSATNASAGRQSFQNWHVHDGGANTTDVETGLTHRGVGFFPKIFGVTPASYVNTQSLHAYCPDATDKTLLHEDPTALPGRNYRDGICMNEDNIIHLKSVPQDNVGQVPDSWTQVPNHAGETFEGTLYITFYKLTPR